MHPHRFRRGDATRRRAIAQQQGQLGLLRARCEPMRGQRAESLLQNAQQAPAVAAHAHANTQDVDKHPVLSALLFAEGIVRRILHNATRTGFTSGWRAAAGSISRLATMRPPSN